MAHRKGTRPVNFIDLTGRKFGRLTVLTYVGERKWECLCDCGIQRAISRDSLLSGRTSSCGCYLRQRSSETHTTHGAFKNGKETGTHKSWSMMVARCTCPNNNRYELYAGKGIRVCERWLNFTNFLADMGERPEGMTIERRDNSLDYCKENCRWATQKDQQNNRTNNVRLTIDGVSRTVAEWADISGIKAGTIYSRLKYGWTDNKRAVFASPWSRERVPPFGREPESRTRSRFITEAGL